MQKFPAEVYASWIDPASGNKNPILNSPYINKGKVEFLHPGKNSDDDDDWVLLLQTK